MGLSLSTDNWSAEGKNVLITGASAGIGAEVARNFSRQGASVALLARSEKALSSVAKQCQELGAARVEAFLCDVTKDDNVKTTIESAIEKFGKFDVVFLNAGRSQGCYFEEINDVESINYMLKINVNGVINTLYHALPSVPKSSSSRIVFISSVAGIIPVPYRSIYCASKHALTGFANSLRIELKDTYGNDAPCVQLICFPEVSGTNLNTGRMTMGADLPPMEWIADNSRVPTVEEACSSLMKQISLGTNEWGQPFKFKLLLPFRSIMANIIDMIILKTVKKTHSRPSLPGK